ncbi:fused MFS/spermidine synthase [Undibacterium sp. TJN19]|uniref:fused MFS/spermidine synthase n=1 Tax=Undibacterium sp. TJN19 TaxID=3413055 RepID=UPI003BF41BFA
MKKPRQSLSRLFLNQASGPERDHMRHLQALHQAGGGRAFMLDDDNLRMMYLNPQCMQSAMKRDAPDELLCAYSRAVMGFLMFVPQPAYILLIGLGGGSLVKYCYRHLPGCRITVLEINADVIAMRDAFMIPADDERLQIIHCDALEHLQQHTYQADVVLLDAYDENGLVAELNTSSFYTLCHRHLLPGGVLVANVWGKPSALADMLSRLRSVFARQVYWLRSADSYNLIVYSIKTRTDSQAVEAKLDDELAAQHPALELSQLQSRLLALLNTSAESEDVDDIPALKTSLSTIMVADDNVPQSYADWKKLVN